MITLKQDKNGIYTAYSTNVIEAVAQGRTQIDCINDLNRAFLEVEKYKRYRGG